MTREFKFIFFDFWRSTVFCTSYYKQIWLKLFSLVKLGNACKLFWFALFVTRPTV